ncbi:MAG: hypothetical protein LBC43_01820 [Bifidobacteriaceae bacterium]|jgi:hypothetical protein|nr:hypothetical protein [Bifidobacteriaceae bacterium]
MSNNFALELSRLCAVPQKPGSTFQQHALEEQIFQGHQAATILATESSQEHLLSFIFNFSVSILRVLDGTVPIRAIEKNLNPQCSLMIRNLKRNLIFNSERYQISNAHIQTGVLGTVYSSVIFETIDNSDTLALSLAFLYNLNHPVLQSVKLGF